MDSAEQVREQVKHLSEKIQNPVRAKFCISSTQLHQLLLATLHTKAAIDTASLRDKLTATKFPLPMGWRQDPMQSWIWQTVRLFFESYDFKTEIGVVDSFHHQSDENGKFLQTVVTSTDYLQLSWAEPKPVIPDIIRTDPLVPADPPNDPIFNMSVELADMLNAIDKARWVPLIAESFDKLQQQREEAAKAAEPVVEPTEPVSEPEAPVPTE